MRKGYLPKVLMMSALALAIAGCASQQGGSPQVRDLSQARQAVENSPQYTVKAGDTLYGIAWQHNLDYRQLAAMNNINPPYQIRPGQTIALREGAGSASSASNQPGANTSRGGAVATGLSPQTASVASDDQELDWLLPDESAIQRNQRLTAERNAAEQKLMNRPQHLSLKSSRRLILSRPSSLNHSHHQNPNKRRHRSPKLNPRHSQKQLLPHKVPA
ncbi:hypothetical protein HORIV_51810 [Vreelandella olivaria]|uniref:LysM domain-containing protein n=1 Tax=Vreelandella olivaria TaxID=390919 RepID=A0ABM7GPP7_9GAMM|nr:hypothetical protein HORIV_51810 [Halomonas olivaria]